MVDYVSVLFNAALNCVMPYRRHYSNLKTTNIIKSRLTMTGFKAIIRDIPVLLTGKMLEEAGGF